MTRELLEQALDALETCTPGDYSTGHVVHPSYGDQSVDEAIDAIRAHLAQPQGEPVAWMHSKTGRVSESPYDLSLADDDETAVPLYEHPAHTEAEVQEIFNAAQQAFNPTNYGYHQRDFGAVVRRILGVPAP